MCAMCRQVDGGGQPGFDHCFVVDDYKPLAEGSGVRESLRLMAVLKDPVSGRAMDVHGTQPGIQVRRNWGERCFMGKGGEA